MFLLSSHTRLSQLAWLKGLQVCGHEENSFQINKETITAGTQEVKGSKSDVRARVGHTHFSPFPRKGLQNTASGVRWILYNLKRTTHSFTCQLLCV